MKPAISRGFSLIELMLVLVVLGVLLSLATPTFDLIEKRRLVSAAEAVYGHLQLARSEAIRQGVNMHINFQSNDGTTWCVGINDGADCDCTETVSTEADYCGIPADGTGNQVLQVVNSTAFTAISAPTTWSSGTVLGSPVDLPLNFVRGTVAGLTSEGFLLFKSPKGLEVAVAMNPLGRVRICSPSGANNVLGYASC